MKLQELQKYFEDAKSNKVRFEGTCHDCKTPVTINADLEQDGKVIVTGGALYYPQTGIAENEQSLFLKCDDCYKKTEMLKNYQTCAVYSRVVGFLRPVSDWNRGKQEEFKGRKVFKNL